MRLTEKDRRLLRLLQTDSRMSTQDLADGAGMSTSACWRRIKTFEEAGLISGFVALIEPVRAGLSFSAVVQVMLKRHERDDVDSFIEAVSRRPEVLEFLATTGEADYHLRVLCEDKDAYNSFLEDFLFRLPAVAHVRTNLVLREIKCTTKIPI